MGVPFAQASCVPLGHVFAQGLEGGRVEGLQYLLDAVDGPDVVAPLWIVQVGEPPLGNPLKVRDLPVSRSSSPQDAGIRGCLRGVTCHEVVTTYRGLRQPFEDQLLGRETRARVHSGDQVSFL